MSHFVDSVVEPVLWLLASWSLRWAVLIGVFAVWLVVWRPRRAATRYLVGLMVLLAGLAILALPRWGPGWRPPAVGRISDPASAPATGEIRPTNQATDSPEPADVAPPRDEAPVTVLPSTPLPSTAPAETTATNPPSPEPLGTRRAVLLGLGGAWAAGVFVFLVRWLIGWRLLERLRRQAAPMQGVSAELFTVCRAALRLRRPVTLATHPEVRSPITLGLLRPAVLVPPTWPDLPEHVQRGGLLHELAHLARRDDWLALLLELVRGVLFFHLPLLWLLARLECERELLCDEVALRRGTDPRDYVRMLLEFSRRPGRLLPAALAGPSYPLRFGKRRTVKTRIHHLLEENMDRWMSPLPPRCAWALGVLVLGLAAGLGCVRIQAADPEEPEPAQPEDFSGVAPDRPAPAKPPAEAITVPNPPKNFYCIKPFDVLKIEVAPTLPGQAISGPYLVEPDGRVFLGLAYGRMRLAGLTLDEATAAVAKPLIGVVADVRGSVSLAGWVTKWQNDPSRKDPYQIKPRHVLRFHAIGELPGQNLNGTSRVVDLDGRVDLSLRYGKVRLAGLTLDEAGAVVEKRLAEFGTKSAAAVTLSDWEKEWQRLEDDSTPQDLKPAAPPVRKADLTYGGKSFEQWRDELVTELKPEVRIEGIKALSAFGANGYGAEAAKAILEIMKGYDVTLRNQDDQRVIAAALEAVRKIGTVALAQLVAGLKDLNDNERRFAVTALSSLGAKAALPALIEAMKDKDVEVRFRAIRGVVQIDPQSEGSIRALAGMVKDEKRNLRLEAMNHLANNASKAKAAVPALVETLQDEDPGVKQTAIQVLTVIGVEAKAAVPVLLKAVTDKDAGTRRRAVDALAAIEPEASQVVPVLARAVKDKSQEVRGAALNYLEKLGPAAKDAVPALVDVLKHGDPREGNERIVVVRALGAMGPAAKEAIPVLTEQLKDNFLRAEITRALSRITQ